jgi:PKD repeat protein
MADRVCNGVATFFDGEFLPADDSITSWRWDFNDGSIITTTQDTISYTYNSPGTYYVTLTIENTELCERSVTHEVIVDALPAVDFSFSESLCDEPTLFTDLTDPGLGAMIISWLWDFGDPLSGDNTSTEQHPVHQYAANDSTYLVSLIVTNSHGCTDSIQMSLTKGLCMQALFSTTGDNQCNNSQVCFVDSSYIVGDGYSIQSWSWDFGDGQQLSYNNFTDSVCHSYSEWGTYEVSLVITTDINGNIFSDEMTRTISVSAVPEARLAFEAPCVLAGTRFMDISFTNGVDITLRWWDFGDPMTVDDTSTMADPEWVYTQIGIYTVRLIVENTNGCQDTTYTDVKVFENPEADFTSSLSCAGGMTAFTDESSPAEGDLMYWLWSFGTGETSGVQDPMYVYSDTGTFLVQMVVTDDNQCADTATSLITVFAVPYSDFDIVNNYQGIQGQILLDNFSINAIRYSWDFGNGDTSELYSPVVLYQENGTYLIELVSWNDNNCPDTAYMQYEILFQGLYVPTGFTPDSKDDALKLWKPAGVNLESYQVTVINERGNIVFQSNRLDEMGSPSEGWDGSTKGEPMPVGNYLWTISAKFRDGRVWEGTDVGDGNSDSSGFLLLTR